MRRYYGQPFTSRQIDERRKELEHKNLVSGRPIRDRVIGSDEVLDLVIEMGRAKSAEEFLTLMRRL